MKIYCSNKTLIFLVSLLFISQISFSSESINNSTTKGHIKRAESAATSTNKNLPIISKTIATQSTATGRCNSDSFRESIELGKIIVPAAVALLVLLVSNIVTLWKIKIESKASLKTQLTKDRIIAIRIQLEQFYDPIHALLHTNYEVFRSFGPQTFPEEHYAREEAVKVWDKLVENVILENNDEISQIIKNKSYLLDAQDNFNVYLDFLKHAMSYQVFRSEANTIHGKFKFPEGFEENVNTARNSLMSKLKEYEETIGHYLDLK